jgi:hypothetical protein
MERPTSADYAPYYEKYVALVADGDIVKNLHTQMQETLSLVRSLTSEQADSRYAPDKWTVKELVGHLVDAERIFSYRALRFGRGDENPLAGFEQEPYVRNGNFANRTLEDLADEFEHLRLSNILLFRSLDEAAWNRRGVASDNEVSVKALAYIMAGHELHHMGILRTRYLN